MNLLEDFRDLSARVRKSWVPTMHTLVDVGRVGLFPGLSALLLLARGSGRSLLACFLLLSGGLASRGLATSAGLLLGRLGRHFCS